MRFGRLGKPIAILAILLGVGVSVGGGATFVALKITTDPKFCASCHIMEPYVKSWSTSGHKNVSCVDCHYEPGLLETVGGKFKALSQLAKYVTSTQGTKPWAEVSDYSCMRSGCHSDRLLEGEIKFGRIRFDHRHHLVGERRGMSLRCTSCHSQIVQGNHLTVTPSTCILCHFKKGVGSQPIDDCNKCHGAPTVDKKVGGITFKHDDYLKRGVACATCHGDVTRGVGEVPRQRCGACHNKQEHLERYDDLEFVHRHHVTEHSVKCGECHTEMQHGLPPRDAHFQGDCSTCHKNTHEAESDLYKGKGGVGVADDPSPMFLARVTCNGCHKPPFSGAPQPATGTTYRADPLACVDCHGVGFDGMAEGWRAEVRESLKTVQANVLAASTLLEERKKDPKGAASAAVEDASARYGAAARNLGIVLVDKSEGVHNLAYARSLLARADEDARAAVAALDPSKTPAAATVGPRIPSKQNCTTLCHVGLLEKMTRKKVDHAYGMPFSHETHLVKGKLDCSTCHADAPHGTVSVKPADCAACHHKVEPATERCSKCHVEVVALRAKMPEGTTQRTMQDLDCETCHEALPKGHRREDVKAACLGCHKDDKDAADKDIDAWTATFSEPLRQVEMRLASAPPEVAREVRAELAELRKAGPQHNVPWAKAAAAAMLQRLDAASKGR